jgi:hypothetical protein
VWVKSILLCRNHYNTPDLFPPLFSITYKKYLVMSQRHPLIVFKGCGVG